MLLEPLSPADAKKIVASILETGRYTTSGHARDEMAKDSVTDADVHTVLRAGIYEPAEWEHGQWRYRVRTPRMMVVVAFRSESELRIVTAWRYRR